MTNSQQEQEPQQPDATTLPCQHTGYRSREPDGWHCASCQQTIIDTPCQHLVWHMSELTGWRCKSCGLPKMVAHGITSETCAHDSGWYRDIDTQMHRCAVCQAARSSLSTSPCKHGGWTCRSDRFSVCVDCGTSMSEALHLTSENCTHMMGTYMARNHHHYCRACNTLIGATLCHPFYTDK